MSYTSSRGGFSFPDIVFNDDLFPARPWDNFHMGGSSQFHSVDGRAQERPLSVASSSSEDYLISKWAPEPAKLHRFLSEHDIKELYEYFSSKNGKITPTELKKILQNYKIFYTEEDFETLFLKINTDRDWMCSWDEFVTYLIMGFESDEGGKDKEELDPPIKGSPTIKKNRLRYPMVRIVYFPMVLKDRTIHKSHGGYVVAAENGLVNYFTHDFKLQRTAESKSPKLRIAQTLIKDCICLPDVMIICIASTERDLRFYDTSANKHVLRLHLVGLPEIINTMHYHFDQDINISSKLVLGSYDGSIHLLEFSSEGQGPFRTNSGGSVTTVYFKDVKSNNTMFTHKSFTGFHKDKITQVEYCPSLKKIISAAEVWSGESSGGLCLTDIEANGESTTFPLSKGVTCFWFDPSSNILATGGPDWILRLWSPVIPDKPFCLLPGHHAGICFVFIQDKGKKVYSVDKEKIIKVWDIESQTLIQTFISLVEEMPEKVTMRSYYNDSTRELIIGAGKFAIMKCCPLLRLDLTDGTTHTRPVSVVLYNELFQVVITCGFDSFIIVWDPWTGTRLNLIKMAHSRMLHGEQLRIEITAACFDPKQQLLLTGARDGSLKVWNFTNGFCVRNMSITVNCEVTAVFWVPDRILAVGWNKFVMEFADGVETEFPNGKLWETQHDEEILCAAMSPPEALVTTSYSGELVLWKFQTGQPYKKFNVDEPLVPIRLQLPDKREKPKITKPKKVISRRYFQSMPDVPGIMATRQSIWNEVPGERQRNLSIIPLPDYIEEHRFLSVQAVVFLTLRPTHCDWGTLLTALSNGNILVWSHKHIGGYLDQFNAIHMAGDSVSTMAVDSTETYLFTGSMLGYVKTWLLTNYCVPEENHVHVSMPELRINFPFLMKTVFMGRAKRSVRHQSMPMLLNSYKAHKRAVTSIAYIQKSKILITGSTDCSVRMWALSGRYIGTFGSPVKWSRIIANEPIDPKYSFRMPPDIKRVASFTTLHVFTDGQTHPVFRKKVEITDDPVETAAAKEKYGCIYGQPLKEPILGNNFELPPKNPLGKAPELDLSYRYIPIWSHIKVFGAEKECDRTEDSDEDEMRKIRRQSSSKRPIKRTN